MFFLDDTSALKKKLTGFAGNTSYQASITYIQNSASSMHHRAPRGLACTNGGGGRSGGGVPPSSLPPSPLKPC